MTSLDRQLSWTKATRKKLHGSLSPHKADPRDPFTDAAGAWTWLRERFAALEQTSFEAAPELAHGPDTLARVERVMASMRSETPVVLDVRDEQVRRFLAAAAQPHWKGDVLESWDSWTYLRALARVWVEVGGVAKALEIADDPSSGLVDCDSSTTYGVGDVCAAIRFVPLKPLRWYEVEGAREADFVPPARRPFTNQGHRVFAALRVVLCELSDEAFADALEASRPHVAAAQDPIHRAGLAYAFSRDQHQVASAVDRHLASRTDPYARAGFALLMASTTDPELALKLAVERPVDPGYLTSDILDNLDVAARPALAHVLEHCGVRATYLKHLKAALKRIDKAIA